MSKHRSSLPFTIVTFFLFLAGCHGNSNTEPESPWDEDCIDIGDRDNDGICDDVDNCMEVPNRNQLDDDGDAVGNACDPYDADICAGYGGDDDADNVCQAYDNCPDVPNSDQGDMDGDGLGDLCDDEDSACVHNGGDLDEDGICNSSDNCVNDPNPLQEDADGDQLGDICDPYLGNDFCAGKGGDADEDNVCQSHDNCPEHANSNQTDNDGDGIGDDCDATPNLCDDFGGDSDGDTLCDHLDNCPDVSNVTQIDVDRDGVGDACDPIVPADPYDPPCAGQGGDIDNDDLCGLHDNCPIVFNPSQTDADGDGLGDDCDTESCDGIDNNGDGQTDEGFPDSDGDQMANCQDPCPLVPNNDADGDGLIDCMDPCPEDLDNDFDDDGLCGNVDNCPLLANNSGSYAQRDSDGDGIGDVCDVEECDGLNNDADSYTDEGLPDSDNDGICDEIDECPNHAGSDSENDGLCGPQDNCPLNNNPLQEDSDGDGWGDACDLDSPEACGPAAPLITPGSEPLPSWLDLEDIIYDSSRDLIYASVSKSEATYGNNLIAIDPHTTSIIWRLFAGSDPSTLAISDDASILYVAVDGSYSVRMINLEDRTACLNFPLIPSSGSSYITARNLVVMPGSPQTLLTTTSDKTIRFYDRGVPRNYYYKYPYYTSAGFNDIELDGPDSFYVSWGNTGLYRFTILDDGFEKHDRLSLLDPDDIALMNGTLLGSDGHAFDPTNASVLGSVGVDGPMTVHQARSEWYFLVRDYSPSEVYIAVYDATTYVQLREIRDLSISTLSSSQLKKIILWGARGAAILTSNDFVIVNDVTIPSDGRNCSGTFPNVVDDDGLCYPDDNCPLVSNPGQEDTDGDGWGDACDPDSPTACGASAAFNTPGTVAMPVDIRLNDIEYDSTRNLIYGSVPYDVPIYGNSVVAIEPETSTVSWHLPVGSDPNVLAISEDASILYVSLDGSHNVQMVNLDQRSSCMSFPIRTAESSYFTNVLNMAIQPGTSDTLFVSTSDRQILVYERGIPRDAYYSSSSYDGSINDFVFDGPDLMYVSRQNLGVVEVSVLNNYFEVNSTPLNLPTAVPNFQLNSGTMFGSNGYAWNPASGIILGSVNRNAPMVVDSVLGEWYFLREDYSTDETFVEVFDSSTYAFLGELRDMGVSDAGSPKKIVRWGTNGLAVLTTAEFGIKNNAAGTL